MILKKNIHKIATILPYKESYTHNSASAVSLWVSEFFKNSKYKDNNFIYGNTKSRKHLTKNYKNISLNSLKYRFISTSNEYTAKLINELNKKKFQIIEVHNRPLVLFKLLDKVKSKFIMYYHNDPLSMSGSKTIKERNEILNKVDKLIFISEWIKNRFFKDLDTKLLNKTEIIYPSIEKRNKISKLNYITFVGRLNYSKGYDIYKNAILKILEEHSNWKALSIGDESRRKIYINHNQHKELGFLNHKKTLSILDKSEIAVVPSRWNEPFGRVALEATSCGCATITSNRGGLPETNNHTIRLKYNDSKTLYEEIKKLIVNKRQRKKIQNLSRKNINHIIYKNSQKIDSVRDNIIFNKLSLNTNQIKILHITNFNERFDGRLHYNTSKRLNNGFIRNGHNVLSISDRDIQYYNKSVTDLNGVKNLNKKIINNFTNFKPDLVVLGHADGVTIDTINKLKKIKNIKICQWFLDPLIKLGPDFEKNFHRIKYLDKHIDNTFLTSAPSKLNFKIDSSYFIPNPSDISFETLNNSFKKQKKDFFFAMSHGVHRGILKQGKIDNREIILKKLETLLKNVNFDFFGYKNREPIWADNFLETIKDYDMALNLSRGKPLKYYSSDRLVQIIGNGLLCFIDTKTQLDKLIPKQYAVYYENINDLAKKIIFFKNNIKKMKKKARDGQKFYNLYYNSTIVSQYLIDKTLGLKNKYKYLWENI